MPIGYLVTLVILSLFAVLVLVRIRRFGHRLFVFVLPDGELPHVGILLLGPSTLLDWGEDDLTGPPG